MALLLSLPSLSDARDVWTTTDTVLQASVLALFWIDYKQTLDIASGEYPGIYETNPLLGEHPSRSDVTSYFIGAAVIHTGLAYFLPSTWRHVFQAGTIGLELVVIRNNYELGLSVRF